MDIEEHGRRWSNAGLGPMFLLKLPGIRKVAVDAARRTKVEVGNSFLTISRDQLAWLGTRRGTDTSSISIVKICMILI